MNIGTPSRAGSGPAHAAALVLMLASGSAAVAQTAAPPARVRVDPSAVRSAGFAPGGGGRTSATDFYSNVNTGSSAFLFLMSDVHGAMEPLFLGREDPDTGLQTDLPAKVSEIEFWIVASDTSSSADPYSATITIDFYDEITDWAPLPGPVNSGFIAGFQVDLVDACPGCGGGYVISLGDDSFGVPRGRCCVDLRCWEYNDGAPPTVVSQALSLPFNGFAPGFDGEYPLAGFSGDNIYLDTSGDGVYQRNERYFAGGAPHVTNLMVALRGDDGCTIDFNGDGYVNGDDIDRIVELIERGCP